MDQKTTVREFFDSVVNRTPYDQRYLDRSNVNAYDIGKRKDAVVAMLDRLGVRSGRVLDIGCGPAVYAPDLVTRGFDVWGIDIAPDVVSRAKQIMSTHAHGHRAHFMVGDIDDLNVPARSFDVVLMIGLFEYLVSDAAALAHVRRVLKPGGVGIVSLQNRFSYYIGFRTLVWPLRPLLRRTFPRTFRTRQLCGEHWTKSHTPGGFARTASRAGFRVVADDYINFNLIPFNAPGTLPPRYLGLLDRVNDDAHLRRTLRLLCGTYLVALAPEREDGIAAA